MLGTPAHTYTRAPFCFGTFFGTQRSDPPHAAAHTPHAAAHIYTRAPPLTFWNATRRRAARGGRKAYTDKAASESDGGDSDEEEDFNADEFEVHIYAC